MCELQLPEYVKKCPWCDGKGEYQQTYNAGCGGGMFKSMGRCDNCEHPSAKWNKSLGYIMENGSEVPLSVINQIKIMNQPMFKIGDIVQPIEERYALRSGCNNYGAAIVTSVSPFELESEHGDMRWTATVSPDQFKVIGSVYDPIQ